MSHTINFGTPSIFPARRKASGEKEEDSPTALNMPGEKDDTPSMLRRVRSPPPSPLSALKRDSTKVAAVVSLLVLVMFGACWTRFLTASTAGEAQLSALASLVREQRAEMKELQSAISQQSSSISTIAATADATATLSSRLQQALTELENSEAKPAKSGARKAATPTSSPVVHVKFIFDVDSRLGREVQLFWLSGNSTEQLYTTIPAGQQVDETTHPGQCWRARDPTSGNHLASYCATSQPLQHVYITPKSNVTLDFHFPPTSKLGKRVRILSVGPPQEVVGAVEQGGWLSTKAIAGAKFQVVEESSGRPLLETTATHEAEQHVDIGTNVSLYVSLPARAAANAQLYWIWGGDEAFAREHLHGPIVPGQTLHVATLAGEQWVARDEASGKVLRTLTTTDAPLQRIELEVEPPAARTPPPSSRFVKVASR